MQGIHDKLLVKGIKDGLTFTVELLPSGLEYGLVYPAFWVLLTHLLLQLLHTFTKTRSPCMFSWWFSYARRLHSGHTRYKSLPTPSRRSVNKHWQTGLANRVWVTWNMYRYPPYWDVSASDVPNYVLTFPHYRGLAPEIVYFYSPDDASKEGVTADWYIKGARSFSSVYSFPKGIWRIFSILWIGGAQALCTMRVICFVLKHWSQYSLPID